MRPGPVAEFKLKLEKPTLPVRHQTQQNRISVHFVQRVWSIALDIWSPFRTDVSPAARTAYRCQLRIQSPSESGSGTLACSNPPLKL
eukprot:714220-Rhodomonas_salina.2